MLRGPCCDKRSKAGNERVGTLGFCAPRKNYAGECQRVVLVRSTATSSVPAAVQVVREARKMGTDVAMEPPVDPAIDGRYCERTAARAVKAVYGLLRDSLGAHWIMAQNQLQFRSPHEASFLGEFAGSAKRYIPLWTFSEGPGYRDFPMFFGDSV
jgi:hypothetical protein